MMVNEKSRKGTTIIYSLLIEVLIGIVILVGFIYYNSDQYNQIQINVLNSQISLLNSSNILLQSQITLSGMENTVLQKQKSTLQNQISTFQNQISALNSENNNLLNRVNNLTLTDSKLKSENALLLSNYNSVLQHSATFQVSNLTINENKVEIGSAVEISAIVNNIGVLKGLYTVSLNINGTIEDSQELTLLGNESKTVLFSVTENRIGKYRVTIDTETSNFLVTNPYWSKIGVSYLDGNGLTVKLVDLNVVEKTGSYEYTISYILTNNQKDRSIDEGVFTMYYADGSGSVGQYGFFGTLFPGDSIARSYTFEELKSKPFGTLEYNGNFWGGTPNDTLKWKVTTP